MKVAIGADHGGLPLKMLIAEFLTEKGHDVLDLGTHCPEPSDYPDFARAVSEAVIHGKAERGIRR